MSTESTPENKTNNNLGNGKGKLFVISMKNKMDYALSGAKEKLIKTLTKAHPVAKKFIPAKVQTFYGKHPKKVLGVGALVLLLLILVAGGGGKGGKKEAGAPPNSAQKMTNVEVLSLKPQNFDVTRSYVGHLLPRDRVQLRAEVEGVVEKANGKTGGKIASGTVLFHISTQQYTLRRGIAQADLNLAKRSYRREAKLYKKKLTTPSKFDLAKNKLEKSKLNLKLAELNLNKSVVTSPLSGVLKERKVEKGEYVNKGQLLGEVLDIERVKVLIQIPERDIGRMSLNEKVQVALDTMPGQFFEGLVTSIGVEADTKNRSFPVEVELANQNGHFRPGMLARVKIVVGRYENQVLIPRAAVLEQEHGRAVFLEKGGEAEKREIQLGVGQNGDVQVIQGLAPGDRLVVKGQHKLYANEKVMVRKESSQTAAIKIP